MMILIINENLEKKIQGYGAFNAIRRLKKRKFKRIRRQKKEVEKP